MRYWMHRISNCWEYAEPLFKDDYLTIGFQKCLGNNYFKNLSIDSQDESTNEQNFLTEFENVWKNELNRTKWNLHRFLFEFHIGDLILVPETKAFSVVEVLEMATPVTNLDIDNLKSLKNKFPDISMGDKGLYKSNQGNEEFIDIGFVIKIRKLHEHIDRNDFASGSLSSRLKYYGTNLCIDDLEKNIKKSIDAFEKKIPINPYAVLTERLIKSLSKSLQELQSDQFEKLVQWYFERNGANLARIPSKNDPNKVKGSDADIIANYDLLKVQIMVQAKCHAGQTDGWAVEQIEKYQDPDGGDNDITYIKWVISTCDNFSEDAQEKAEKSHVRLINGESFAEMLINSGLDEQSMEPFFPVKKNS